MPILLSLGALALGVLLMFGALATDGPATFPLVLAALLWAAGLTGVIVFAIYGKAMHDRPRGQWYRNWLARRRQRTRQNGTNGHLHTRPPIAQS
jgi:hypothetical protein